ncbi:hypothetical protein I3842_03G152100 [Carya illinoinensis]|uniref:Uncharacterized protein n=1 Tax=Carya illinoinensis TaxID=32201 RepID=A0A922FHK9_CARIL|nr:hypothetical protein I3842_03G152100 [Carya illinoinensis]
MSFEIPRSPWFSTLSLSYEFLNVDMNLLTSISYIKKFWMNFHKALMQGWIANLLRGLSATNLPISIFSDVDFAASGVVCKLSSCHDSASLCEIRDTKSIV